MSDFLAVESHLKSVGNYDLHPSLGTSLTSLAGHKGIAFNTAASRRAPAQFHVIVLL